MLPENREAVYLFDADYNFDSQKKAPCIKKQLVKDIGKKQSDQLDLMNTALKTIDQYPDEWVYIYTDGSASNGTRDAGYGVRLQYPDMSCIELSGPCGMFCTNYEAEAIAIETALKEISSTYSENHTVRKDIVIFTDAMSVLQALENDIVRDKDKHVIKDHQSDNHFL